MANIVFLLLCVLIPGILTQCTVNKAKPAFKRSVYEFSVDLMGRLAQEKENHFVSSTYSIWSVLACTSLGAADRTLAEIKKVLKLRDNKCFNEKFLKLAYKVGNVSETDVVLERTSAIFVDDKIPVRDLFKNRVKASGISSFENLEFSNADAAAQRINDYVSKATHDVIDEIVTPADLDEIFLIIVDAIFFKGTWKSLFPLENTEVSPFYNEKAVKIGEVKSMSITEKFDFRSVKELNASIIEIPYGSGRRYSMLIFRPFENVSLYTVIGKLKLISLRTIRWWFDEFGPASVDVQIPRFKITSDLNNLRELLEDMGLKTMFDSNDAQFPHLSEYPLYVTNIIQKADIEVTEEGTVAAAVTKEEFSFRNSPSRFIVNKPFLFMIIDKKFEIPLFVGAYSKPSIYS